MSEIDQKTMKNDRFVQGILTAAWQRLLIMHCPSSTLLLVFKRTAASSQLMQASLIAILMSKITLKPMKNDHIQGLLNPAWQRLPIMHCPSSNPLPVLKRTAASAQMMQAGLVAILMSKIARKTMKNDHI